MLFLVKSAKASYRLKTVLNLNSEVKMANKRKRKMSEGDARRATQRAIGIEPTDTPNYDDECENCGQLPTVGSTGLCGPCCFGEADTIGGNW